ncbi:MAG: dihydrodipicolinate synthase family protein [Deltaproteobacteria bacterium]|nr:dihydrodipicolinate synthase family protein [Deltaproteobacteria bacterium]MCB2186297.1 dihydrodipicolinate synthase family protein [Deltaproteobacteria bacterium]
MSQALDFRGVFPILVTPFLDDESLDLASLDRVVRFMVGVGVQGVTVLGVLGEANRLVDAEREEVIRAAVAATAGRIPVVVGVSHTGSRSTAALAARARELGAAAVMVAPFREPVPNDQKIFDLYQRVAEEGGLPIVLQDHPASTQVHLSVPLMARMVAEIPQVACVKEEAVPTAPKLTALAAALGERQVPVLVGLGALYALFDLERGADGFMTGFAFPEVLLALVAGARAGDWHRVRQTYRRFLPLMVYEQQPGLAIRKEIYRLRGLIKGNRVRHPGATIDPATAEQLARLLAAELPGVDLTQPLSL